MTLNAHPPGKCEDGVQSQDVTALSYSTDLGAARMGEIRQVTVPDIGDFHDVPIIDVTVKPGDRVKAEEPLITLESDKASMEVPSPSAGLVKSVLVKIGDKVSQGTPILSLEVDGTGAAAEPIKPAVTPPPAPTSAPSGVAEVRVPDIGDFKDVPIIEVSVKPGDKVSPEQPLITLESDKASMEVPSPLGGVVAELKVKVGDRVSEGTVVLTLMTDAARPSEQIREVAPAQVSPPPATAPVQAPAPPALPEAALDIPYAGPSVRKLARERGIDLRQVKGSGRRGRIIPEDVINFSAAPAARVAPSPSGQVEGLGLLPWPKVDFAKFGAIESKPLSRIRKISGPTLHRNWVMIPHVTNHDECDITDLDEFRKQLNKENEKSGVRVSILAFMIKAAVASLKRFPEFNSSLEGDNLILKKYYHIGFAADTPQGLVVPVIRDADKKGVIDIAKEMGELAKLARDGKLKPDQMQGGTFTISSLGGIGGTYFTPIINAPEVAIMGACRSFEKPVWDGKQFLPRLYQPLSLSWDHRVIDGAAAARFNAHFGSLLTDMRRALV
ncbi:dihydrolipoyllysine-residue acetyltransferase [Bradyrhizobium sp.]|uniref:dihydrolipoyllysine-residue acetyltransferase n=1 Tax=Bradyrhizobium sp. TaxID=376 RepID=UPI003C779663